MHDLNLALRYCDNVVLMRDGRVDAQGAPQDVFTQDRLQRIFGLDVSLVAHQGHRLVYPLRASEVGHEPDTN
jgi:iron complex transport system ATP-binding protein